MDQQQLNSIFTYHPPFKDQPQRYKILRAGGGALAKLINDLCPESREKSLAITQVQQAIMWANAAIEINENPITEKTIKGENENE